MSYSIQIECLDCQATVPYHANFTSCPSCGSAWCEARYDFPRIGRLLPSSIKDRPFDLWRYRELLPVLNFQPSYSMGEGGTPIIHAANLGLMLGCSNIYIKDERQGPTHSFKDRQAAVGIAALKEAGITEMVLASTGNVAISFSAYAARGGIKCWAFLTSLVPAEKMREVAIYGTEVVKVTASYDQAKQLAAEFAHQRGLYLERGARSIPSVESMKTIAFEAAEQLPGVVHPSLRSTTRWQAPDWYIQAVSGGMGPLGVLKGFTELYQMGLTQKVPAIACIQTDGCSPMALAWKNGKPEAEPVRNPRSHIATLSTGDPGRTYTLLFQRIRSRCNGTFESVPDQEAFRATHVLAKMEGISVEPAAAVAFAGLFRMARAGMIKPTDVVLVNCTGHTMPVEPLILGEGWSRNVVIPSQENTPQEGLLAALTHVSADRYPRVLIADDTEDARRLIRRILQAQGNYTLYEASNGQQTIEIARSQLPDLIILDLMMPEMDGFAVLDALKANADTAPIPVVVVTAKELSAEERKRLHGQTSSVMQKGEFMNDDFIEEVKSLVN